METLSRRTLLAQVKEKLTVEKLLVQLKETLKVGKSLVTNTHAAPILELSPYPPIKAVLPSLEREIDEPCKEVPL